MKNSDTANCVYTGYQDVCRKSAKINVSRLLFPVFCGLKQKITSSWNPQSQAMRHECIISLLKQNKPECSGKTQLLQQPKNSNCVIRLVKLRHLYSGIQKESSGLNSCLGAQHNNQRASALRYTGTSACGYSQEEIRKPVVRCDLPARQ